MAICTQLSPLLPYVPGKLSQRLDSIVVDNIKGAATLSAMYSSLCSPCSKSTPEFKPVVAHRLRGFLPFAPSLTLLLITDQWLRSWPFVLGEAIEALTNALQEQSLTVRPRRISFCGLLCSCNLLCPLPLSPSF